MLMVLAGPLFLLAAIVLPGPISRLAGVMALAILLGVKWRVVAFGSFDLLLLLAAASFAHRFDFAKSVVLVPAKLIAAAIISFLGLEFGACALLIVLLTRNAFDALPFVAALLLTFLAMAVFVSRRQEHVFTRRPCGSLVSASPQA